MEVPLGEFSKGESPVRIAILLSWRHFREGPSFPPWSKNRVIAKSGPSFEALCDSSVHSSYKCSELHSSATSGDHRLEVCSPRSDAFHQAKDSLKPYGAVNVGRIGSREAVERLDKQA